METKISVVQASQHVVLYYSSLSWLRVEGKWNSQAREEADLGTNDNNTQDPRQGDESKRVGP